MTKILLVEDDNNLREIYELSLKAEGFDTLSANNGEEGLAVIQKERPNLIISDVMMPKLSGFEMLERLSKMPDYRNIPVIMMTALNQAEDRQEAEHYGIKRYLVKSQVTSEDFVRAVRDVIAETEGGSAEKATPEVKSQGSTAAETAQLLTDNAKQADSTPSPESAVAAPAQAADTIAEPVATEPSPEPQPQPDVETPAPEAPEKIEEPATEISAQIDHSADQPSESVATSTPDTTQADPAFNPIEGASASPTTGTEAPVSSEPLASADEEAAVEQQIQAFIQQPAEPSTDSASSETLFKEAPVTMADPASMPSEASSSPQPTPAPQPEAPTPVPSPAMPFDAPEPIAPAPEPIVTPAPDAPVADDGFSMPTEPVADQTTTPAPTTPAPVVPSGTDPITDPALQAQAPENNLQAQANQAAAPSFPALSPNGMPMQATQPAVETSKKKVVQPINDLTAKPDIDALAAKEHEKEQLAQAATQLPTGSVIAVSGEAPDPYSQPQQPVQVAVVPPAPQPQPTTTTQPVQAPAPAQQAPQQPGVVIDPNSIAL